MLFGVTFVVLFDNDTSFKRIYILLDNLNCFVIFFSLNIDSRIGLRAGAHYLWYVDGKHQGHRIAFSDVQKLCIV